MSGESAARLKHCQGTVQVDTHTQVEIGFGRRTHYRGEVKDTARAVIDDLGQGRTVRDVPGGHVQTRVSGNGWLWRDSVQHHYGVNRLSAPLGPTSVPRCNRVRARRRPKNPAPPV